MKKNKISLKINKKFGMYKKGDIVTLDADAMGFPQSIMWRNRLRDAPIDGCVEIVKSDGDKKKSRKTEVAEKD